MKPRNTVDRGVMVSEKPIETVEREIQTDKIKTKEEKYLKQIMELKAKLAYYELEKATVEVKGG